MSIRHKKTKKICLWNLHFKFCPNQLNQRKKITMFSSSSKACISFSWLLTANLKDLVDSFSCNIESGECMNNSCESFPKYQLMKTTLKRMLNQVQILMNRIHLIEYHPIEYNKWMTINEKVSKRHDVFVF